MTAQVHEKLILDGKQVTMDCEPRLPFHHPRLVEVSSGRQDRKDYITRSTACWRRYVATWELHDGRLFLLKIAGRYALRGSEPLFAAWHSGVLSVPIGRILHYVHMGHESVYEQQLLIAINQGNEVNRVTLDNRDRQFESRTIRGRQFRPSE